MTEKMTFLQKDAIVAAEIAKDGLMFGITAEGIKGKFVSKQPALGFLIGHGKTSVVVTYILNDVIDNEVLIVLNKTPDFICIHRIDLLITFYVGSVRSVPPGWMVIWHKGGRIIPQDDNWRDKLYGMRK